MGERDVRAQAAREAKAAKAVASAAKPSLEERRARDRELRRPRMATARVLHFSWGLPTALVGAFVWLVMGRGRPRRRFRSSLVTEWRLDRGLSLGPFIFVPERCPRRLLVHEYGHVVQALILGPFYLPFIVLPSLVWAGTPALERRRRRRKVSYYSFYTERWANRLAERVCHEPSMH